MKAGRSAPERASTRLDAELRRAIVSGDWPPGHRVPAENDLAQQYGCSRMTAHKVMAALAADGLITRRRRAGTFVANPQSEQAMLEIADPADQAAMLGAPYRFEILSRDLVRRADGFEAVRVLCRHLAGTVPLVLEDRDIMLAAVPGARDEGFSTMPPSAWLLRAKPWTEAEHVLGAVTATAALASDLDLAPGAACLVLRRRTWHEGELVTEVNLTYPGDRHRFVGRFGAGAATLR